MSLLAIMASEILSSIPNPGLEARQWLGIRTRHDQLMFWLRIGVLVANMQHLISLLLLCLNQTLLSKLA